MKAKLVLLFAVTVCLCFGQMCGVPIPAPNSPIPEGTYTGTMTHTLTMTDGITPVTQTIDSTQTVMFGPNGLPLLDDGREYFVGAPSSTTVGGMQINSVVQGIATNVSSVSVTSQDQLSYLGEILTGPDYETYISLGNGQVYAQWECSLANTDPSFYMGFYVTASGYLARQ